MGLLFVCDLFRNYREVRKKSWGDVSRARGDRKPNNGIGGEVAGAKGHSRGGKKEQGYYPVRLNGSGGGNQNGRKQGKARTRSLVNIMQEIKSRQDVHGEKAVVFGWVKAHIGISGNEEVDALGTEESEVPSRPITEGGLKAAWKELRWKGTCVKGTGEGKIIEWSRKARVNYGHCRTGKGNLAQQTGRYSRPKLPLLRGNRKQASTSRWSARREKRSEGSGARGKTWMRERSGERG